MEHLVFFNFHLLFCPVCWKHYLTSIHFLIFLLLFAHHAWSTFYKWYFLSFVIKLGHGRPLLICHYHWRACITVCIAHLVTTFITSVLVAERFILHWSWNLLFVIVQGTKDRKMFPFEGCCETLLKTSVRFYILV